MFFENPNFHRKVTWFKLTKSFFDENLELISLNEPVSETILQRIASGDSNAVEECLDQYGGLVWSLARRMLPDVNEAEDAVQEIFVEIWKNAERFDENKSSETTFVAMIARRRLIDRLRKVTRKPGIDSLEDILIEPSKNENLAMETKVDADQASVAMRALKPDQQKVLQLSIVQGYSHQEISDVLKIPLGTVKTHARRGLIEVRQILEKNNRMNSKEVSA